MAFQHTIKVDDTNVNKHYKEEDPGKMTAGSQLFPT